jgi:hypothetical protein
MAETRLREEREEVIMAEREYPKGWGLPAQSKKAHYFDNDSFSLCRKYGFFFGEAEDTNDDHPENCAQCKKKKAQLEKIDQVNHKEH